jgi:hypothetical protein
MSVSTQPQLDVLACSATICRFDAERSRWRVVVEAWPSEERYEGRLVFQQDDPGVPAGARASAPLFTGRTAEEVVSAAYELPEKHVRAVLHSLI